MAGVRVDHGDIRSASDFETLADCDWIIDAAANPSVTAGVDGRTSSRQVVEHNLHGTTNVLEFARHCGAGVVLLSTSRVYSIAALAALPLGVEDEAFVLDATAALPPGCSAHGLAEDFSTSAPLSLYGATKLASEVLALEYGQAFGFPVVVNRCGVLAGAGQFGVAEQGIFSFWMRLRAAAAAAIYRIRWRRASSSRRAHAERPGRSRTPPDFGTRAQRRCDLERGGRRKRAMSLAQLSRFCAREFGPHSIGAAPEPRPFDVPWVVMDHRRVATAFGWQPRATLDAMLSEIVTHHRDHPQWLDLAQPR